MYLSAAVLKLSVQHGWKGSSVLDFILWYVTESRSLRCWNELNCVKGKLKATFIQDLKATFIRLNAERYVTEPSIHGALLHTVLS